MPKPFIKWAGGKTLLAKKLIARMPEKYNTYIEPFIGGGSIFFEVSPENAFINDINNSLINCYNQIKGDYQTIVSILSKLESEFNELDEQEKSKYYYIKRDEFNKKHMDVMNAALFVFLNKTCFNGLYRENKSGCFNVPFGHKKKISLYDEENMQLVSEAMKNAKITCLDFEEFLKHTNVEKGDFVFIDSPYAETFSQYNQSGFTNKDHERLASLFHELSDMGVYCMETNNACGYIYDLYKQWSIEEVDVMHAINRKGDGRMAKEVIITNY